MNEQQWSADLLLLIIGHPPKKTKNKNLLHLSGILNLRTFFKPCARLRDSLYCCIIERVVEHSVEGRMLEV